MEKRKYTIEGQTVMVQITNVSDWKGQINEVTYPPNVFAIAVTIDNAIEIAASLNAIENLTNKTNQI